MKIHLYQRGEMKIITDAFAIQHSRRDRPSGLSDGQQWTNLKVCPYSGVFEDRQGVFEGIFV